MVPHPEGFDLPPRGELKLQRGGKHVMLIDVKKPLAAGDTLNLRLTLSEGSPLAVDFPVRTSATDNQER
jgi:copper(I)-binding protein